MKSNSENPITMNTIVLAYLGDAVYEMKIREHLVKSGQLHGDILHASAVRFVNAKAQAEVIHSILDDLPEAEQALVRRAKNHKVRTRPKNVEIMDYKWATAFEALIGYYHLAKKKKNWKP
jgi:ribonuclease-3 family protein